MRSWPVGRVSLVLFVLALGLREPAAAQPPSPAVTVSSAEAGPIFRDLLTRFYDAYSRKDLPAVEALWHPQGPARYGRNVVALEFDLKSASLLDVVVKDASITPAGGRARVIVDLRVTDAKTGRVRRERRVREMTFLQDQGTWKIWNDSGATLGMEIAARLLAAAPEQRAALIASDPEVRSDDTLAAVALHVNRLRSQGSFSQVLDALAVRTALARALDDEPIVAASLLDTGLVQQVLGNADDAARAYTEARALYAKGGTRSEVAIIDSNLASVQYLRADYPAAAEGFRRALEVFEAENDSPRIASALHGLGNALYMQGDFEPAMEAYQRCLRLHEASGDKYSASAVLQAIALVHKEAGSYSSAVEAYARSAVLSAGANDLVGQARAEHGIAEVSRLQGDYGQALQHFAASLALWERTPDAVNRAATIYATGQVHALQRNFARAIEWYQRAYELDQQSGEAAGLARDLGGLGGAHFGQGRLELALDEYGKSLALREQLRDAPGVMWTVVHMGVLQSALGRQSEALEAYQRALRMAESNGDPGAVCTVLALRASNELARDDAEAALASATKAAEIAERVELFDVLANAKVTIGKAQRKAGRIADAIATLQDAVSNVERVPVGPGVETFFDDRRAPYAALVDLLASESEAPASRVADAFRSWERARTRNLAVLLGGDGSVVVKGLSQDEVDGERRRARAVRTLDVRLKRERGRAKPDQERLDAMAADLGRAQADRAAFNRALLEAHPGLATLRAQSGPAEVDVTVGALGKAEALVSFVVLEQRTHVFVVAGGEEATRTASLATIDVKAIDLAPKVAAFRDAVARRDPRASQVGRELYDLLLAPLRDRLRGARGIVVVPDAFLWSLPFEALQDERGRYLVQDAAVSYAISATALVAMRATRGESETGRPGLTALADPALAATAVERLALVRQPSAAPFPAASREVRSLSLAFGPQATQLFSKDQARTDRVSSVRAGSAVHLAVPGCLSDASPLFSLLALSPASRTDPDQGLAAVADAMAWTLPSALVTLSRVDTAQAPNGEALTALAWAFHVAGAGNVVVNRWLPEDARPSTIVSFYRNWLVRPARSTPRPTAAVAMQKAARGSIAQPGTTPAEWAGFMVMGR